MKSNHSQAETNFRKRVEQLRANLQSLLPIAEEVHNLMDNTQHISEGSLQASKVIDALNQPDFYVCFIGPYSAGKSELINRILGRDVLPVAMVPTTACPTYIHKADSEKQAETVDITYLNEADRQELRQLYLNDFLAQIDRAATIAEFENVSPSETLTRIEALKEEHLSADKALGNRSYECLRQLLAHWTKKTGKVNKGLAIDAAKKIKEQQLESVLIKQVDVYLSDLPYSPLITLVDLPGLSSDNIRHEKITERHVFGESKSNAFVFVFSPEKMHDDKTSRFIKQIHNRIRSVHSAFWVINKWDLCEEKDTDMHREFVRKRAAYHIQIDPNRLFCTSALLHAQGQHDFTRHGRKAVQEVDQLQARLFDYLSGVVFDEYLQEKERFYRSFMAKVRAVLEKEDIPDDIHVYVEDLLETKARYLLDKWREASIEAIKAQFNDIVLQLRTDSIELLSDEDIKDIHEGIQSYTIDEREKNMYLYSDSIRHDTEPNLSMFANRLLSNNGLNAAWLLEQRIATNAPRTEALQSLRPDRIVELLTQVFPSPSSLGFQLHIPATLLESCIRSEILPGQIQQYIKDISVPAYEDYTKEVRTPFEGEFRDREKYFIRLLLWDKGVADEFEQRSIEEGRVWIRENVKEDRLPTATRQADYIFYRIRQLSSEYVFKKPEHLRAIVVRGLIEELNDLKQRLCQRLKSDEIANAVHTHIRKEVRNQKDVLFQSELGRKQMLGQAKQALDQLTKRA